MPMGKALPWLLLPETGNSNFVYYPARFPHVIAVAATDQFNKRWLPFKLPDRKWMFPPLEYDLLDLSRNKSIRLPYRNFHVHGFRFRTGCDPERSA